MTPEDICFQLSIHRSFITNQNFRVHRFKVPLPSLVGGMNAHTLDYEQGALLLGHNLSSVRDIISLSFLRLSKIVSTLYDTSDFYSSLLVYAKFITNFTSPEKIVHRFITPIEIKSLESTTCGEHNPVPKICTYNPSLIGSHI